MSHSITDRGARRMRLREFQTQLVERMQAVRSGVDTRASKLGVMIGQTRCLLNLQDAGEIVAVGTITHVPLTQDWFLGLANIRGNLVSVIDFARFQGQMLTAVDKECRIVAFSSSLSINCGVVVSKVFGLRNLTEMELQEPLASPAVSPWVSGCYRDRDAQIWLELDLSLVVQDPRFLQVGL